MDLSAAIPAYRGMNNQKVVSGLSRGNTKNTTLVNKGPVRIQSKYLVPIYVFLEMKLLFPKQNFNVLSPSSYIHISVRDLYISRIGLPILLQENIRSGIYKSLTDT